MSTKAKRTSAIESVPLPPSKPLTGFLQYRMDVFRDVQKIHPEKKVG